MLGAMFSWMAALCGWVAVVIPSGGNVRFNPLFWLLALPLLPWIWGLQSMAPWAVNTVWLALLLAPCLSLAALLVAPATRDAALLGSGMSPLDTPGAMLIVLAVTTMLALAGAAALRRSSLPGGTRPVTYLPADTPPPGPRPLPGDATAALMLGSVTISATLMNGFFFALTAMLEPVGPAGPVGWWPVAVVAAFVLTAGVFAFRGSFRLVRRRKGAAGDLRAGWWIGMVGAVLWLAALWAWPTILQGKLAFSAFMIPLALAAAWCGRRALRALPTMMAGDPGP